MFKYYRRTQAVLGSTVFLELGSFNTAPYSLLTILNIFTITRLTSPTSENNEYFLANDL